MTWIRFPALPSHLYNRKIITEIGELVGKVVKLDLNTDCRSRGRFARMAVYINLEKSLISQTLINGRTQMVEYESLSTICFHCGRYGHVESICTLKLHVPSAEVNTDTTKSAPEVQNSTVENSEKKDGNFGPWIIVEWRSRRKTRDNPQKSVGIQETDKGGSRSIGPINGNLDKRVNDKDLGDLRKLKGKETIIEGQREKRQGILTKGQSFNKSANGYFRELGSNSGFSPSTNK
ncbi:hypothetical protein J1N35_023018 [Gossypium stocksii]|uniref:CCHC-type domain-containing protein n=1 Tax=Gossypium stocksii TaxID=47602 RepID=A0A9D4A3A7_9ROSI|nr:hypothetical protein J1N35_023018 [Gossypium stocksii]